MSLNLAVILGSVRRDRVGVRVAQYVVRELGVREHAVTLVDPVEYRLPLLDRMYKEHATGEAPEMLEKLAGILRQAEGYVIVSGEYNHSIPPAM